MALLGFRLASASADTGSDLKHRIAAHLPVADWSGTETATDSQSAGHRTLAGVGHAGLLSPRALVVLDLSRDYPGQNQESCLWQEDGGPRCSCTGSLVLQVLGTVCPSPICSPWRGPAAPSIKTEGAA